MCIRDRLSYVYAGDRIYFHCAKQGHKLDAIARQDKVSFCVIDQDRVVPEAYTSYFRSVIAFGRARILEEEGEVRRAIELLAERYFPEDEAGRLQEIERRDVYKRQHPQHHRLRQRARG